MKKRLLSLVLCLVMVFSLFPAFAAPAMAADVDDQYEEATPADGRSWTTNDTYTYAQDDEVGYFAYDETDHKYYRVQYQSGKDLYTATEERDWQPADARGYYYGENKTTFYPVTVSDGDVYTLYTNANGNGDYAWVGDDIIPGNSLSIFNNWDYGSTKYYVYYPEADAMRHLNVNTIGYTAYDGGNSPFFGGYYTVFWYFKDESGISFPANGDYDCFNQGPFSTDGKWKVWVRNENVVYLANTGKDINYGYHRRDSANGTEITDSFVLNTKIYTKSTLPKTINYNNGQVLGSILLSTDVAYHGKLYSKAGITGTTKLWYTRDNGEVVTLGASAIDQDTLYDGTLYIQLPDNTKYVLQEPDPSETSVPEDYTITNPGTASDDTGKIKLNKTLEKKNGAYDLTLESYAVAGNTTVQKTVKTPTDFVVVVDQSGSMDKPDIPTGYGAVSTQKTLEQVAAGEYYVNVDGEYYRVFAKRGYLFEQFKANSLWTEDIVKDSEQGLHWFQSNTQQTFTVKNQYYVKDGTAYRPVNVEIEGKIGTYYVQFYWYRGGVNKEYFDRTSQPWYHSVTGGTIKPGDLLYGAVNGAVNTLYPRKTAYTYSTFAGIRTGMFINQEMYKRHVGYTGLYYRDVNGEEHPVMTTGANPIESTEYCNSSGNAVTTAGGTTRMNYMGLYTASGTTTRLDALKAALNQFASAVAGDKDDKGYVQNRVAIVGFASEPNDTEYWNTEMLTVDLDGTNGKQMRAAGADDYARALVNASADDNGQVNSTVSNAINAITARGGTQPEFGFRMAKSILDSRSDEEKANRNSVVIFFTDGRPGDQAYMNQYVEANDVVEEAYKLKTASYEPTIYSIGVFGESDGNPLLEPRSVYNNDLRRPKSDAENADYEYEGGYMEKIQDGWSSYYYMRRQWRPDNADYTPNPNDTIYDYMSVVSSNYPNAHTFIKESWLANNFGGNYFAATEAADVRNTDTALKYPDGKLKNDYYRMASTQATLVAAFEDAITKTVETEVVDETTSALDANTAIRDKINLDLFNIENATYSVKIVPVRANVPAQPVMDGTTKVYNWTVEEYTDADHQPTVVVPEGTQVPADGVLTASGMDYATAYVNRRHDGYKLVLEVTGLQPKKFNTTLTSNDGNASVVPNGGEFPLVEEKSPTLNAYHAPVTITWVNYDDSVLQSKQVPYGDMPVYEQDTPVHPRVGDELFTFIGWDSPIVAATESKTYKAVFESKNMESKTVIADFNSYMVLATETSKDQVQVNVSENGAFSVNEDDQAVYQLNSSTLNGNNTTAAAAVDLTPYSGGDSARIEGRHINLETGKPGDEIEWKNVTVYPASNVYFSDHTAKTTVIANDQIGFNKGILPDSITADDQQLIGGRFFQFQGTGIDIYCKTTPQSGTVSAVLYKFVGEELKSVKTKIVMNASADGTQTRFNAPTVFFNADDGVDPAETYVVRLYAASQADYHLDGIRVYNANQSTEKNVTFVNLRSMLLGKESARELPPSLADGAVFYTDSGSMGTAPDPNLPGDYGDPSATDEVKKYEPNDYQHQGPKNEVYLAHDQAIGFQVQPNQEVMVSMRVPEGGNAVVRFNKDDNQTYLLSSMVDMYYPVTANENGIVFIENLTAPGEELVVNEEGQPIDKDGNVIEIPEGTTNLHNVPGVQFRDAETFVSLVNVKFTPTQSGGRSLLASAKLNTFAMSAPTVKPEPEVEPTPEVTPDPEPSPSVEPSVTPSPSAEPSPEPSESPIPSISSLISQFFSSFLNNLFGSISRLFGN